MVISLEFWHADGNVAGWSQRVSRDYFLSYRQNQNFCQKEEKCDVTNERCLIKMRNILAMPNYCVCKHLPAINLKQQQLPFLSQPLHILLSLWGKVQRVPAGLLFNPGANTHSDESGRQGELNAFFQRLAFGKLSRKEIFSFFSPAYCKQFFFNGTFSAMRDVRLKKGRCSLKVPF